MNLIRRELLLGAGALTLAGCATTGAAGSGSGFRYAAAPVSPSPKGVGDRVADAYLAVNAILEISGANRPYHGVHYADAACAYGAAAFAAATGNQALLNRVVERHNRITIDNTANHVDVSVYGVWPMELGLRTHDAALSAKGQWFAENQWKATTPDGLTTQARYWIDDVWMIGALQVQAWRVSHDPKYLDHAALMARLYTEKLQQPNGLFFHGPNARFHWGRGNGWVAAGLAELLSELPPSHKDYAAVMGAYQRMMAGLLRNQADDGMWRQLIDYPEAWKETSGTAMFAYAMVIGARRGILTDPAYTTAYQKAWAALCTYIQPDGKVTNVCAGTGQQNNAQFYLNRPKRTGDFHGQAPVLWFATALLA